MNIVMFTNTFAPHIGGVAHSVSWLADDLRRGGHRVLVVAPEYDHAPPDEIDVIRVPALQHFAGSDFALPLPFAQSLDERLHAFAPDIVHSHHPFLLGTTALRASAVLEVPVVYTYHTRYECYCHHVTPDAEPIRRLVLSLSFGYCNLCDAVIAPSPSMANHLTAHGVTTPVSTIPTGVDIPFFASGNGIAARVAYGIPPDAFVVGHVGRLAREKNLDFLAEAAIHFLLSSERAHLLVVGQGGMMADISGRIAGHGLARRAHFIGAATGERLADAYKAMDAFAFSSRSETQGLVLAEAMAAGVPVVALDAPGASEIVRDRENGRLLPHHASPLDFADALIWVEGRDPEARRRLAEAARTSAEPFSRQVTTASVATLYSRLAQRRPETRRAASDGWRPALRLLAEEWKIWSNLAHAVGDAVLVSETSEIER